MPGFTEQFIKARAIGAVGAVADIVATSGWMHRSLTHRAYKLPKKAELVARTIVWGNGIVPRAWAAVHRIHHEFADTEKDPHSPVQQGRYGVLKVALKNPFLYRKAAKEAIKGELPKDLQPDWLDGAIFDNPKLGIACSILGHMALNKLVGNPIHMGLVSFAAEKMMYVAGGNAVNSVGHAGSDLLRALFAGKIIPNADGTYGANSEFVGFFTLGEGMQKYHHDHPSSAYFGPTEGTTLPRRLFRDSIGAVALELMEHNIITPGTYEAAEAA